ncbi:hypothetical protein DAEQUDRAFT_3296 [Daedalea quercina L-15889]|uniref:Uncharacterized protein n=1 Tax=Daedalea quercina L-15889 TaxID=1314783 RepID=A0A165UCA6_9APHY|nr:hypothetical protein DAEQUDRAFT_3296 [Daedalea quercina L-15889]
MECVIGLCRCSMSGLMSRYVGRDIRCALELLERCRQGGESCPHRFSRAQQPPRGSDGEGKSAGDGGLRCST